MQLYEKYRPKTYRFMKSDIQKKGVFQKPSGVFVDCVDTVEAYCFGGLALTKAHFTSRFWIIIHIKSGLSMGTRYADKRLARSKAVELLELPIDWQQDETAIRTQAWDHDNGLKEKIRKILFPSKKEIMADIE